MRATGNRADASTLLSDLRMPHRAGHRGVGLRYQDQARRNSLRLPCFDHPDSIVDAMDSAYLQCIYLRIQLGWTGADVRAR